MIRVIRNQGWVSLKKNFKPPIKTIIASTAGVDVILGKMREQVSTINVN